MLIHQVANPNQLHEDWVAYHTFTTSLELRAFASVARTLPAHNATVGITMDVVAYSAYAGVGIYTGACATIEQWREAFASDSRVSVLYRPIQLPGRQP